MKNSLQLKFALHSLWIGGLLFSNFSQAQFTGFGVETGPGTRILFGNESLQQSQQHALGFSLGINTEYRINNRISFRSGIYYELKGGQTPVYTVDLNSADWIVIRRGYTPPPNSNGPGNNTVSFRNRDNFHFISLPLLFKVKLGTNRNWYLNAGASVGYLMAVRVVTRLKGGETMRNKPHNELFSVEYSALLGVGYERKINEKWSGNLEIRNHTGLNNLLDAQMIVGNGSLQTQSCYLLAGLTYRISELW